jgi:hypothetical protein
MAESGRIELRRVSPRLTAYKAVSAPNGLRFPYQKPMQFEGIGNEAGDRGQDRTGGGGVQTRCLTNLATRSLVLQYLEEERTGHTRPVRLFSVSVLERAERSKMPSIRSQQRRSRGHF